MEEEKGEMAQEKYSGKGLPWNTINRNALVYK